MNRRFFFVSMTFMLVLAACAPGAGGPGPRTWIDAPLDGVSMRALGPLVVRSHAAATGGTAQAALLVNGARIRVDLATDPASSLVEFSQTWVPEGPGVYVLQVISSDRAGNEGRSNAVHVRVGEVPVETGTPAPGVMTETSAPATPTPTWTVAGAPTFTFDKNTNCRAGDSTAYDVLASFLQSQQADIEGRNQDSSWFRVLIASGGHCWVSAATGTPAGPYAALQVVVPPPLPPTATPAPAQPPAAPGNLQIAGEICNAAEYKVTVGWGDVSEEDGYKVYRDGTLIATLGPNANSYTDSPPDHNAHTYAVEAFSAAGTSARPTVQEDGCLF
jgi:hypothetical protein